MTPMPRPFGNEPGARPTGRLAAAAALVAALAASALPVLAQEPPPPPPEPGAPPVATPPSFVSHGGNDRDTRRLFQRFIEDAAITPGGWAEGQLAYTNLPGNATAWSLTGLFAFRVQERSEAGIRLGWERLSFDDGPDGSGLQDIDLYYKVRFPGDVNRCAVGGLLKLPTADKDKGLGTGEWDVEVFGSCRADLRAVTVTANAGLRYNGSPGPPFPDTNASLLAGGAVIIPAGPSLSFVIEGSFESERFKGQSNDARLTFGVERTPRAGFGWRAAVAAPLSDGAPDAQAIVGAIWIY